MTVVMSAAEEENNNADKKEQQMWLALKRHIIRERQRKKEEHEAEVEEERLRKEREARERQDVMTLGETREQIQQLEIKLSQLKEEKHQLFLQLKKVLNEDDNRKRQQFKDSKYADSNFGHYSEMLQPMNGMVGQGGGQTATVVQSQLFLPPTAVGQGNPPPNHNRPLSAHLLNKHPGGMGGGVGVGVLKRGRSPSPPFAPPAPPHLPPPAPPSPYHHQHLHPHPQGHINKHSNMYPNQGHKVEDGRIGREMARAVLWNKPSQYSNMGGNMGGNSGGHTAYLAAMSPVPERPLSALLYSAPPPPPPAHLAGPQYQKTHYHQEQSQLSQLNQLNQLGQPKHDQQNKDCQAPVLMSMGEATSFASGAGGVGGGGPPPSSRHMQLPHSHPLSTHAMVGVGVTMPIYTTVQGVKPGSITSGYPVRPPPVSVQNQNMYPNRHRY